MKVTSQEIRDRTRRNIDITRYYPSSITNTVHYAPAFKTWAALRLLADVPTLLDEIRERAPQIEIPDQRWMRDDPEVQTRHRWHTAIDERLRYHRAAIKDLAARFEVSLDTLLTWSRRYLQDPDDFVDIDRAQMEAFYEWEQLRPHRALMRSFDAFMEFLRETPGASREQLEALYSALDEDTQRALRPAVDAYLMAGDLADEVRRLTAVARQTASNVYAQRREALLEAA